MVAGGASGVLSITVTHLSAGARTQVQRAVGCISRHGRRFWQLFPIVPSGNIFTIRLLRGMGPVSTHSRLFV
jgi:hypothetical protein